MLLNIGIVLMEIPSEVVGEELLEDFMASDNHVVAVVVVTQGLSTENLQEAVNNFFGSSWNYTTGQLSDCSQRMPSNLLPQANVQQFPYPSPQHETGQNTYFQGFMAHLKRSSLLSESRQKSKDAFIDSRATYLFSHSKKAFMNYRHISGCARCALCIRFVYYRDCRSSLCPSLRGDVR